MALDEEASACQSRLVKSCGPSGLQDLAFSEIDSSFASSATGGASDRRRRFAGHPDPVFIRTRFAAIAEPRARNSRQRRRPAMRERICAG